MAMSDKFKIMWKELAVACFKLQSQHYIPKTEVNHENSVRTVDLLAGILTRDLPVMK
jgi:hypothetical protein